MPGGPKENDLLATQNRDSVVRLLTLSITSTDRGRCAD